MAIDMDITDDKLENESEMYKLSAMINGQEAGHLVYRRRDRVRVYSIEVVPEQRRQGVGSALMHHLVRLTKEREGYMMETYLPTELTDIHVEDAPAYFLWRCGMEPESESELGTHYVLRLDRPVEQPEEMIPPEMQELVMTPVTEAIVEDEESGTDDQIREILASVEEEGMIEEEETAASRLAQPPVMQMLTDADLICGSCIYRSTGRYVMSCHKYADKPYEVLTDDECEYYTKPIGQ